MKKTLLTLGLLFSMSSVGCSHWGHHGDCGGGEHHHGCGSCCKDCKDGGGAKGDEGCKMKHADQAPAGAGAAPADTSKSETK